MTLGWVDLIISLPYPNINRLISKGWGTGAVGERGGTGDGRTLSRQPGGGGGLSRKDVLRSLLYQPCLENCILLSLFLAVTWFFIFLKFKMVW